MPAKTPHYGHAPIKMRRVANENEIRGLGDFYWFLGLKRKRSLVVAIPYKGPTGYLITQWTIEHRNESGAQWGWNNNEDEPTLQPSLHAVGIWHGWVRCGSLVEA